MKAFFMRPQLYWWIVLVLMPLHSLVTIAGFSISNATWFELGKAVAAKPVGAVAKEHSSGLSISGVMFHIIVAFFVLEMLAMLVGMFMLWRANRSNVAHLMVKA